MSTYDNADRVTGIAHTAGYSTLASYAFTWDAAGQLTQEVSSDGTVDYTYDPTGQLLSATGWRNETFTYDALGNRTMPGYQTGPGNRLLSDGSFNYTYDNEGNLLTKTEIATGKVTEYTWDHRNRLTSVKVKDSGQNVLQESTYTYDPFDKRIGVSDDPDGPGPQQATVRWTVYDGLNPYADFDGQGNLTHRHLYGPAVDMIMASLSVSGQIVWDLTDHLGSVRDRANTSGQVIDHIAYDSFGRVLAETNPSAGDRFKFTAREYDAATGQYYYRARYYDAAIGRFTSEDPLGFDAGDLNLFRYVSNRPVVATDPSGLYDLDFHFYVIYLLFRAKGWPRALAEEIAAYSQYVDESADTFQGGAFDVVAQYHFPGSGTSRWTQVGLAAAKSGITRTANRLLVERMPAFHAGAVRAELGIYLHAYADSFAHHGFSGYKVPSINRRPRDSGGRGLPDHALIGHADLGHIPDDPGYSEENLRHAMGAAMSIYDLIPACPGGSVVPKTVVADKLKTAFCRTTRRGEPVWSRYVPPEDRVRRLKEVIEGKLWRNEPPVTYNPQVVNPAHWGAGLGAAKVTLGIG